jgi:hypothetical protein
MFLRLFTLLIAASLITACPPADKQTPSPAGKEECAKVGQNCELSPGKLGTCVMKDGCTGAPSSCFVCQSQH